MRLICLNLLADATSVRSFYLFLLSLFTFTFLFLVENGATTSVGYGYLGANCKSLAAIDLSYIQQVSRETGTCPANYNELDRENWLSRSLLLLSCFLCWIGNNTIYKSNITMSTMTLIIALVCQISSIVLEERDNITWCHWKDLSSISIPRCLDMNGNTLPPNPTDHCQSIAYTQCQWNMIQGYFLSSFPNLIIFLCSLLLTISVSWTIIKDRIGKKPSEAEPLMNNYQHIASTTIDSWYQQFWDMMEYNYIHYFLPRYHIPFTLDTIHILQQHNNNIPLGEIHHKLLSNPSASSITSILSQFPSLKVKYTMCLRIWIAIFTCILVPSILTLGIIISAGSLAGQEWVTTLLICSIIAYCFSMAMLLIHICALRVDVKKNVCLLVDIATNYPSSLIDALNNTQIRRFSVPLYTGTLFGCVIWCYIIILFVVYSLILFRSVLADNLAFLLITLLTPILVIVISRSIAATISYYRCYCNPPFTVFERPINPYCYICCDWVLMFIGGWGSIATVLIRLCLAFPTAVARLDMPTSTYDFAHSTYMSLVQMESYRIFQEWRKIHQSEPFESNQLFDYDEAICV